jgi:cell division protein FtsZ
MLDEKLEDEVWITVVATGYEKGRTVRRTEQPDQWSEPAGEPRVSRARFPAERERRSSVDVDVPEFIPRF